MSGGSHASVLLEEAVEGLRVRPAGIYVDGTFGRGGHSRRILERLSRRGRLIALDRDAAAIAMGKEIEDKRLRLVHRNFSHLREILCELGAKYVDGVLLDLGVSSPQLDEAQRGFSFRFEAPLDMRMDTTRGITAAEWLANADEREITEVIREYGEERFAKQIAAAIVAQRAQQPLRTTRELARLVAQAVRTREPGQDPATRTFQALRIHINQELAELKQVLPQCVGALKAAGRLVVISFHSLEDRIVKRFLREQAQPPRVPLRLPLRAAELPLPPLKLIGRAQHASAAEVARNPRARSAVMRIAERTTAATKEST